MNNTSTIESHKDYIGAKMGMWLFLFTELLLFGGLFLLYAVYRYSYHDGFQAGSGELSTIAGTVNTVILITSSLTMAVSISAIQKGNRKLCLAMLLTTIFFAAAFMVNKYFEWGAKIHHGIYPGSPELLSNDHGTVLFYGLYYVMTGLHGLHVIVGIILLSIMFFLVYRGRVNSTDFVKLENSGLYWHFVDLIWIFLFPLFYLIT